MISKFSVTRNRPSASITNGIFLFRVIFIISDTVCNVLGSRPKPGPITRTCSLASQGSMSCTPEG